MELRLRRSEYTSEEEVVGRKDQPLTGPPRHEVQSAAAVLKYSLPFCTVKLPPLQNDVLEIRSSQPRPQLYVASCNEHLTTATVHAATAPRCLNRQPQCSAMLSLGEVPYCESAVMKTRLNCHESARMSAAAPTGSIGSIFDVSMGRGGRHQRPTAAELWKGIQWGYLLRRVACGLEAAPQATFVRGPRRYPHWITPYKLTPTLDHIQALFPISALVIRSITPWPPPPPGHRWSAPDCVQDGTATAREWVPFARGSRSGLPRLHCGSFPVALFLFFFLGRLSSKKL